MGLQHQRWEWAYQMFMMIVAPTRKLLIKVISVAESRTLWNEVTVIDVRTRRSMWNA